MVESIQQNVFAKGQSQPDRLPNELNVHYADVDERSTSDFLLWTKEFSSRVKFIDKVKTASEEEAAADQPALDWSTFFPYDKTDVQSHIDRKSGNVPPHLGLFMAFLELYKHPQEVMNRLTGRHLNFYYRDVLRIRAKPPVADRAHLLLELKKNASPIVIGPNDVFSAGKDEKKIELLFAPTRQSVINRAEVASLRSIYRDDEGLGTVRAAPIANSADGLGGTLSESDPKWYGFGSTSFPVAEIGFAIAAPVLRMQEGTREINVRLKLDNVPSSLTTAMLKGAFDAFLTGEKGWLRVLDITPKLEPGGNLVLVMTVSANEPAIVDYDSTVHGYSYAASSPILQLLLRSNSTIGYTSLANVIVHSIHIDVKVSGVTSLKLESDSGTLDPKKAFQPFGAQGERGSRFFVGYDEALSKKLSKIEFTLQWKAAPANFRSHYDNYGRDVDNSKFRAVVAFHDAGAWHANEEKQLFSSHAASDEHVLTFTHQASSDLSVPSTQQKISALGFAGGDWSSKAAKRYWLMSPVWNPQPVKSAARLGYITFTLDTDFLHSTYRNEYVKNVVEFAKGDAKTLNVLNEPYTPTIQSMSFTYHAYSNRANVSSPTLDDFANDDVTFFHIEGFGTKREHSYQRTQFDFLTSNSVTLLPKYKHRGEMLIGLRPLKAGDSVSLLMQVAQGSADPDQLAEPIEWFALCDNYWKPLSPSEVVLDTTNNLLTSGIVTVVVPQQATTNNSVLPADHIWIKAAVKDRVAAVSQLIEVAANAIEVEYRDQGNEPRQIGIPKDSISKPKTARAEVKKVKQPYASFGLRRRESDDAFHTRVAERLRHKDRCVTSWDYERIVLESFPDVHRAKCVPHANGTSWLAPGNVLLVVVPDLRNQNAINPLEPKVSADLIQRITEHVATRTGIQMNVHVVNPRYQKVRFDFKVKMNHGYEFNFYRQQLNQQLIRLLSPWAVDITSVISFGETVYKSIILDHVEELEYVDYVTEFKMYSYTGATNDSTDLNVARPRTPDAILVSTPQHQISPTD